MNLYEALRKVEKTRIAFVGSGGKTTAIFQLARLMEPPVVVTCSTHLGAWQTGNADRHIVLNHIGEVGYYKEQIEGVTLFSGPIADHDRFQGLGDGILAELSNMSNQLGFSILIEADGSRQRPLKAPNAREPLIPEWIDMVVIVAGLSGIGKPLNSDFVHRPDIFSLLSELEMGEIVHEEDLARVLTHRQGGLKDISAKAKRVLILNQADNALLETTGLRVATQVIKALPEVIITSLFENRVVRVIEPVAGILLAGGESSRYGKPKMLLPWDDSVIIRHITETALKAGLDPVIVVLGAESQTIRQELTGLPVSFIDNPDWKAGQSTSIRQGLRALPIDTGSALFLLSDQPQVTNDLISALIDCHQKTLAPIVAPRILGQRANPVLFDRSTFEALMALRGDIGGRAIFPQFPPKYVNWKDEKILFDIDTPDDYERLRGMG